ncbi:PAS domain S-box protein [Candidatus Thiodiazotropha sp. CDECU1]|uniref:PAS domain S-box protein n=1 Tax=Candidatus Thiodiazotropha sp. CDECU1 TaxID=3065865 RepID=UPI00292F7FD8|nr:PAS domain S-box protein [Candidatus Thiodiazotropha sp. CDECU1]
MSRAIKGSERGELHNQYKDGKHQPQEVDARLGVSTNNLVSSGIMGNVALLNVDPPIYRLIHEKLNSKLNLEDLTALEQLYNGLEQGRVCVDALVLGVSLEEPVRIAQRIQSLGIDIPVLILTEPEQYQKLKNALKFAPFIGNDVLLCSIANAEYLPQKLYDAVERVHKRRRYIGSMKAAQVSLGSISRSRPPITSYYERLLDHAPIGVVNININGAILNLNRHACQVLDINERDALGTLLGDLFTESERDRLQAIIARCVAPLGRRMSEIFQIGINPIRFVELNASSFVDRSGQLGATIILQDVSDRIHAEEDRNKALDELRASEHRYRELVETMSEALALTDAQYNITFINQRFCDLFGYAGEEIIGQPLIDLVHENTKDIMLQRMADNPSVDQESFETTWLRKDGNLIYTLTSPKSIFNENQQYMGCLGVFTDITDRKEVEQREKLHMLELAQASRVSTIGEMSSQIAHELAQPLSAIGGLSTALLKLLDAGTSSFDDITDSLISIQTQANRAREIIIRLRDFVRNDELRQVSINLNDLINSVIRLANVDAYWSDIKIVLLLDDNLPNVTGDGILIEQVLLNLVRNACHAMQDICSDSKILTISSRQDDSENIRISVEDTGPGLNESMLKQVCQPFFSTKEKGMGMGLAIARSVVEAHAGQMLVSNTPQGGASFSFTLPINADE